MKVYTLVPVCHVTCPDDHVHMLIDIKCTIRASYRQLTL